MLGHSDGGCIAGWHAARFTICVGRLVFVGAQLLSTGAVSAPWADAVLAARPDRDNVKVWKLWRVRREPVSSDDEYGRSARAPRARPGRAACRNHQQAPYRVWQGPGSGARQNHRADVGRRWVVCKEDFI